MVVCEKMSMCSLGKLCAPFSSPFAAFSPFLGPAVPEVLEAEAACCWASLSRYTCCRVCTTSGITASISERDSIGRPSNRVPSWGGRKRQLDYREDWWPLIRYYLGGRHSWDMPNSDVCHERDISGTKGLGLGFPDTPIINELVSTGIHRIMSKILFRVEQWSHIVMARPTWTAIYRLQISVVFLNGW